MKKGDNALMISWRNEMTQTNKRYRIILDAKTIKNWSSVEFKGMPYLHEILAYVANAEDSTRIDITEFTTFYGMPRYADNSFKLKRDVTHMLHHINVMAAFNMGLNDGYLYGSLGQIK